MRRWEFTSESVTEGHPDKMADQISDAILDAILGTGPHRPASPARLFSPLAWSWWRARSPPARTSRYPRSSARWFLDRLHKLGNGLRRAHLRGRPCPSASSPRTSPWASTTPTRCARASSGEDALFSQGAGDQGMMFGYACDETEDLMPVPIWLAHRLAQRLAQVRKVGVLPYLRPDGKTQVTFEYEDGRPVRLKTVLISTQHRPTVDLETLLKPDLRDHVVTPIVPAEYADDRYEILTNPTGRFELGGPSADTGLTGPEDHRRHLRWRGPPRRWCVLRQGPVEGGPFRRLRGPLGGQARRRLRGGPALRTADRLRHRRGPPRFADGRALRHRAGGPRQGR